MPAQLNSILYYSAIVVLVGGIIVGVALALRARREAREGVDLTSEADMLSEFQRARDAGEMDEAEFRRVRDLLISGKSSRGGEHRDDRAELGIRGTSSGESPPGTSHAHRPGVSPSGRAWRTTIGGPITSSCRGGSPSRHSPCSAPRSSP